MPNRILKESICTSDSIDQLSAFEETVFYRLIVSCDDYGRFDGRPKIIASKLFPLKDIRTAQIESALRALTSAELVTLYEVDGKPFLQMKTWDRHQQVRAKKSKYPSPESGTKAPDNICNQLIADACNSPRNPIQSNRQSESESESNNSAETSPAQVATLTLVDGSEYAILETDMEKDAQAYPGVDVLQEYRKMQRWLEANPKLRKTKTGIRRFINSWLDRAQNSARRQAASQTYTEDKIQAFAAKVKGGAFLDA